MFHTDLTMPVKSIILLKQLLHVTMCKYADIEYARMKINLKGVNISNKNPKSSASKNI